MSTDVTVISIVKIIIIGLTLKIIRLFINIIRENNTNTKLNNKKANCHSFIKIILNNEINRTGIKKKNKDGLWYAFSVERNSKILKSNLIKSSAHLENLSESEDIENPNVKW